jgi:hypothetical protein
MKLITSAKVSCLDLDIQKSKETIVVTQESRDWHDIVVHGFDHQGKDGVLHHLFSIRKHNSRTLAHD